MTENTATQTAATEKVLSDLQMNLLREIDYAARAVARNLNEIKAMTARSEEQLKAGVWNEYGYRSFGLQTPSDVVMNGARLDSFVKVAIAAEIPMDDIEAAVQKAEQAVNFEF